MSKNTWVIARVVKKGCIHILKRRVATDYITSCEVLKHIQKCMRKDFLAK